MEQDIVEISKEFRFTATHHILNRLGPGEHEKPHTHHYRLIVTVEGAIPENGMVMDFSNLKKIIEEHAVYKLAHKNLNDILFQPSAEHLAVWIWDWIEAKLPVYVTLKKVKLYENESSSVTYSGKKKDTAHTCSCSHMRGGKSGY